MTTKAKIPQRKSNKTMSAMQLLTKAVTGIHKVKTEQEKKNEEIDQILNGKPRIKN